MRDLGAVVSRMGCHSRPTRAGTLHGSEAIKSNENTTMANKTQMKNDNKYQGTLGLWFVKRDRTKIGPACTAKVFDYIMK